MMENKKLQNFSEWYTEAILRSEMADYAPVQGCMVFRELSYAIWENLQKVFDKKIKETGHKNVYFPLFIPESLLKKESEHFQGFTPEVGWVDDEGGERLAVRPTSETIICHMYAKWIRSHRDLPMLLNQWCSVIRFDTKTTKPFLRTREFLWHEGHTMHAKSEEAQAEVLMILGFYKDIIENLLAIPVIAGKKSEGEKFPGADYTTCLESLMADGKALQMATSHNLGQNFSKAFSIKFLGEDGKEAMPWYTTWAFSTRLLGAMIMVHGDDKGIVIPPRISPLHCAIVPIYYSKEDREKVLEKARELKKTIESSGDFKCEIDLRDDKTPGWKYSEWEMKGIPLRIELGKRDMEKNQVTIVRRDTGEKLMIPEGEFAQKFPKLLDEIQDNLFRRAKKFLDGGISEVNSMQEFSRVLEEEKGFVRGKWCSGRECEEEIKTKTGATCRLIPFEAPSLEPGAKCFACGEEAQCEALFAKSY